MVDVVAAAEELPLRLIAAFRHTALAPLAEQDTDERHRGTMDKVLALLRGRTGHDFSQYKKSSVSRRIERRMSVHQLDKLESYAKYVREHPQELDFLFKELLIGVTSFFRDPASWEVVKSKVIPALFEQNPEGATLRAWVPACSTGEEAYSLAMAFSEALDERKPVARYTLQIFATDLDPDAIAKARQGLYPANIQADVGPKRLDRFFREEGGGFRMRSQIRNMVTFAPQDVLLDPPFTKLDLVSCRNLLIYLGPEVQKKLIALFHYSLNPGGMLFLGSAETISSHSELFDSMDAKVRLFRRRDMLVRGGSTVEFPSGRFPIASHASETARIANPLPNLASLADQALLQRFCPAAVLVNEKGDIVYISGRTGKYLEPATGQANWNIHAMAREGLRSELTVALRKALRSRESITIHGLKVGTNGGAQIIDVSVQAIDEPVQLRGMIMIVFTDVPQSGAARSVGRKLKSSRSKHMAEAELAIRQAREESRRLYEDMQTSQEELKSANEELQSINEELTTSKEEMQSMNEELQTVNAELQSKVDELTRTSNDMKNLLDSTDIATIFLDAQLHVRRFTTHATEVIKL
jgi:two-component system CheB/CheR fusion protein